MFSAAELQRLRATGELDYNRECARRALQWIATHQRRFWQLVRERVTCFWFPPGSGLRHHNGFVDYRSRAGSAAPTAARCLHLERVRSLSLALLRRTEFRKIPISDYVDDADSSWLRSDLPLPIHRKGHPIV